MRANTRVLLAALLGSALLALLQPRATLAGWTELFGTAGLSVDQRWKDLHVLSPAWILRKPWHLTPFRLVQALALALWPLTWQYQVYFLCSRTPID